MIVPYEDKTLLHIYQCPVCGNAYMESNTRIHKEECLVAHTAGSCCHYGDRIVSAEARITINDLVTRQKIVNRAQLDKDKLR